MLIIDDNRDIARGIGLRFSSAGYEVVATHDGQAGLDAAVETQPDIIILDIRMPVMDGLTVLAKLQDLADTAAIPTVVLSANIAENVKTKALELGARYFVEKPFDSKVLVQAVNSAVTSAATEKSKKADT